MEFKKLLLGKLQIAESVIIYYWNIQTLKISIILPVKYFSIQTFRTQRLIAQTLRIFPPSPAKSSIILQVNGEVSGYVNDLKAKSLIIQSGQATYVKGDFRITGLPSIRNWMPIWILIRCQQTKRILISLFPEPQAKRIQWFLKWLKNSEL